MTVATFETVKGHEPLNIRKPLELALFGRRREDGVAPLNIKKVWSSASGLIVPDGLEPLGLITKKDGVSWPRQQDSSEVESHGYGEPTRVDITKDVTGLKATLQESKKSAMEIFHGLNLSSVQADADGNIYFDKPARPQAIEWELFAIGKDGDADEAIYMGRYLPRARVTENGTQAWTEGEEILYPATWTGFLDTTCGTSFREIWGGPGMDVARMGFKEYVTP